MPANTPKGYPYPLGTDRLMDGDDSIKALATAIDGKVGVACSGQFTAVDSPSAGVVQATTVTFPVGLFTAPPIVVVSNQGTNPTNIFQSATIVTTTTSVSVRSVRTASASGVPISWIAVQVP